MGGGSGHSGLGGGGEEEGRRFRGLPLIVYPWDAPVGVVEDARGSCGDPRVVVSWVTPTGMCWEEDDWKSFCEVEDCEAWGGLGAVSFGCASPCVTLARGDSVLEWRGVTGGGPPRPWGGGGSSPCPVLIASPSPVRPPGGKVRSFSG